ncbi:MULTISPECIES: hypothetical protein [unclassified Maridesulfovibrio]|uniref:hypothetical protein n=1 Tax=unclassified Maridesulfovibrio TaxID=2794999 RepID=UPI003B3EE321
MNAEYKKVKSIYIGYHPRTHDGSSPKSRNRSESVEIMDAFNKKQADDHLKAEVVGIAFTDLCAVAVMEKNIGKVWQYL